MSESPYPNAEDDVHQFGGVISRVTRDIKNKVEKATTDLMSSINTELNRALGDLAKREDERIEIVRRLERRDKSQTETIAQLIRQVEALQTQTHSLSEKLTTATEEKNHLTAELNSVRAENASLTAQLNSTNQKRDALTSQLTESTRQINEFRSREGQLTTDLSKSQSDLASARKRIGELETQIISDRNEFRQLGERNTRDQVQRLRDHTAELQRKHCKEMAEELTKCSTKAREMKSTFERALKVAEHDNRALEADRDQWHTKYQKLVNDLEERERRLTAEVQRRLTEKCNEVQREFNAYQAANTSRSARDCRPFRFRGRDFTQDIMGSSAQSAPSVFNSYESDNNHENIQPRGTQNVRKRPVSSEANRQLAQNAVPRIVTKRSKPTQERSMSQQPGKR